MELFVDESRNTGQLLISHNRINFGSQQYFTLGIVCASNQNEKDVLIKKYREFKNTFNIDGVLKGSDLLKKENNDKLEYLLLNIFNDENFYVCMYDKRFYLATNFMFDFFGIECRKLNPKLYYEIATMLCEQDDRFLVEYVKYNNNSSKESLLNFLNFTLEYELNNKHPYYLDLISQVKDYMEFLKKKDLDEVYSIICTNTPFKLIINRTALYESLLDIMTSKKVEAKDIKIFHHRINGIDKEIGNGFDLLKTLWRSRIEVEFLSDEESELIQLADNVAAIIGKSVERILKVCTKVFSFTELTIEDKWLFKLFSKISSKLTDNNLKYTLNMNNLALLKTIAYIFSFNDVEVVEVSKQFHNIYSYFSKDAIDMVNSITD